MLRSLVLVCKGGKSIFWRRNRVLFLSSKNMKITSTFTRSLWIAPVVWWCSEKMPMGREKSVWLGREGKGQWDKSSQQKTQWLFPKLQFFPGRGNLCLNTNKTVPPRQNLLVNNGTEDIILQLWNLGLGLLLQEVPWVKSFLHFYLHMESKDFLWGRVKFHFAYKEHYIY